MRFRNYSAERLMIDSIASRLTDEEKAFRIVLMERSIERGEPLNAKDPAAGGLRQPNARSLIESLIDKRAAVKDDEGRHYDIWFSKKNVDEEIAFCLDATEALTVARMIFRIDEAGPGDLRANT